MKRLVIFLTLLFACVQSWWPWESKDLSEKQKRFDNITDGLKKAYNEKLKPLEEAVLFGKFYPSMIIEDADFEAKPTVLLLGEDSTGKTTFVKYLLQEEFPGEQIGPEPTTDSFVVVMYGEHRQVTPGHVLAVDKTKNFRGLRREFGSRFLQHFKASCLPNAMLKSITLIDSPGILSGKKQQIDRGYSFEEVSSWFAERADMIILFFDVTSLDIIYEFQRVIERVQKHVHPRELKVILNKADSISTAGLIRVYGGLMWGLGKILNTPEVPLVYMGSFIDKPYEDGIGNDIRELFEEHKKNLTSDLQDLSQTVVMRRVDKMIERADLVKAHAYILSHLQSEMPGWLGNAERRKKELIENLAEEFEKIQLAHDLPSGDFPDVATMQKLLVKHDFKKFPCLESLQDKLATLESMLAEDLNEIGIEVAKEGANKGTKIKGGVFKG